MTTLAACQVEVSRRVRGEARNVYTHWPRFKCVLVHAVIRVDEGNLFSSVAIVMDVDVLSYIYSSFKYIP